MKNEKWQIFIIDKNLDERVGEHSEPKIMKYQTLNFADKKTTVEKYEKLINKYMKNCYDWKGHSEGAIKFYYEKDGINILTQLLVYCDGEEVMEGLFE